jgi:hypothetical protein
VDHRQAAAEEDVNLIDILKRPALYLSSGFFGIF